MFRTLRRTAQPRSERGGRGERGRISRRPVRSPAGPGVTPAAGGGEGATPGLKFGRLSGGGEAVKEGDARGGGEGETARCAR